MAAPDQRKALGAYYTPPEVVDYLVGEAAARLPNHRVLDPACGDGRFLAGLTHAVGVDLDAEALTTARDVAPAARLVEDEFFAWSMSSGERFDSVVGNPPFIRYQRFSGEVRASALAACERAGVTLSALSSSWAPFVIAAAEQLRDGGRLAMVVPAEIGHAVYARPVLGHLMDRFASVEVIAVRERLFPGLSEDCWLLICKGYGGATTGLVLHPQARLERGPEDPSPRSISRLDLETFSGRLRPFLLPRAARALYLDIAAQLHAHRLGDLVRLGIGYVTGANDFFHLRPSEAAQMGVPDELLKVAVRSNRSLPADDLSEAHVERWLAQNRAVLLLALARGSTPSAAVQAYLDSPGGLAARRAYKCRNRSPWWWVPDVRVPDGFLTVMSGRGPRLVANSARAVCTNSVHAVFANHRVSIPDLVVAWDNPLTALSCEIEGHPLGGGMLKVEPREARRLLLLGGIPLDPEDERVLREGAATMQRWRHLTPVEAGV